MKSKIKQTMEIILKLNQKEALWLKQIVQNPLCQPDVNFDEPPEDKEMRELFWDSLEGV